MASGRDKPSRDKPGKDKSGKDKPGRDKPSRDKPGKAAAARSTSGHADRSRRKSDKDHRPGDHATSVAAPVGQRFYDMPYSATAPRLIHPEIGLHNLVSRAGHNAAYSIDVTLLDAPDHRLIRSGVLLAHRVLDGRGEWYLGAPEWQPALPQERVESMGQADLPEGFADLVRPFRRRATLGPVAALTCDRREFALRDDRGTTMALLRDDKVTVRRGGLTTARYREVTVTPTEAGLTDEQAAHLTRTLASAGATAVMEFPRLVTRLGAPATGPTDFPVPQELDADASFTQFVSQLLASRLREILSADLNIRAGQADGTAELTARAAQLRVELQGLSSVLDVSWLEDLDEELGWVAELAERQGSRAAGENAGRPGIPHRLRGERYLTLLDRLVTATRAPQLGNASSLQAAEVLGSLVNVAQGAVVKAAGRLRVDSPSAEWAATGDAFDELFRVTGVAARLLPERVERLRHRLGVATQLLTEAAKHSQAAQHSKELAARSAADDAFALGRAYEHELAVAKMAREAFVRRWVKTSKKLE